MTPPAIERSGGFQNMDCRYRAPDLSQLTTLIGLPATND